MLYHVMGKRLSALSPGLSPGTVVWLLAQDIKFRVSGYSFSRLLRYLCRNIVILLKVGVDGSMLYHVMGKRLSALSPGLSPFLRPPEPRTSGTSTNRIGWRSLTWSRQRVNMREVKRLFVPFTTYQDGSRWIVPALQIIRRFI
jgi:hypothetical protein